MKPAEPPNPWAPVDVPRRAVTLDVLRGFAILGVLVANTLTFAYPIASSPSELPQWRGTGVADTVMVALVGLLVEGKFYSLLGILFGMGLILQTERATAAGRPFVVFYIRRSALLFVIGVLHGVLLYPADILSFYAIVSLAALPFRDLRPRALATAAVVCGMLGIATLSLYAWSHPARPYPHPPDWSAMTQENGPAPDFIERAAAGVLERAGVSREAFFDEMAAEPRIYREGSWLELTKARAIAALLLAVPSKTILLGFIFLALFLFGMVLARSATSVDSGRVPRTPIFVRADSDALRMYRTLWYAGVPIGLALVIVAGGVQALMPRGLVAPPIYWVGTFGGLFLQALGYAGGVLLVAIRRPDGLVVRALAPVGRTALSNYLLQSVVLGFVFYSTGLGLFTRLTAVPVVALSVPVFALEISLSRAWLRRYSMGPVEWAWRTAAYGTWLPLRLEARRAVVM